MSDYDTFYDNKRKRPFDFADLNGKPDPEKWGPKYSKPSKPGRKVAVDRFPTNCASGQKHCFNAAKHRAKLRAEFAAEAEADKRNWAMGTLSFDRVGMHGGIEAAYAQAMAEKRARLAIIADMREAA